MSVVDSLFEIRSLVAVRNPQPSRLRRDRRRRGVRRRRYHTPSLPLVDQQTPMILTGLTPTSRNLLRTLVDLGFRFERRSKR